MKDNVPESSLFLKVILRLHRRRRNRLPLATLWRGERDGHNFNDFKSSYLDPRPDSGLRLLESSDLTRERQVKFDGKTRELRESEDFERFTAAAAELQLVNPNPETRNQEPETRNPKPEI